MRNVYIILFCFFFMATLTALFAPQVVSWYFDPPTAIGVSCKDAVVWGITAYQKMVLAGGALGIAGGIALAFAFRKKTVAQMPPTSN